MPGAPWPLLFGIAMAAAAAEGPSSAAPRLDTVLVTGEQPGPGMWRVSRDGHVLWILGTQSPLPRRMRWRADEVQARVAQSQAVLAVPAVRMEAGVGPVGALLLLPSLMGARRNPDKLPLAGTVPEPLYARWSELKRRYLPRHRAVESWRPLFAAHKLYEAAIRDVGLSTREVVWRKVERSARRHKVAIVEPVVQVRIEAPRETLKQFRRSPLDDVECFALTLERLETDLEAMKARAAAWAVGDVDALRALPFKDHIGECIGAVLESGVFERQRLDDLPERLRASWLEAAESALAENASTVAVLPMRLLLEPDSVLAALRAKGYTVEEPE